MILSQRERYIGIATVAVLGLLGLDRYVLTPLIDARQTVNAQVKEAIARHERADRLFQNARRLGPRWNDMVAGGLQSDVSEAESKALHALRDWAAESRLNLSSLKPERVDKLKRYHAINFRATGTGSMESISKLLYRIQTSKLPMRVTDLQITARREGTDDLSLQLGVSTIYLAPEPQKPIAPASTAMATISWGSDR